MENKHKHYLLLGSGVVGGIILNKIIPIGVIKMIILSTAIVYGIMYFSDFKGFVEKEASE